MKPQCIKAEKIPLSIYVHLPWCKKKCPYCDFNSHEIKQSIPEKEYCEALLKDFFSILSKVGKRKVKTIFFGGGTPNLFSPKSIKKIISNIRNNIDLDSNAEITLESNPSGLNKERSNVLENLCEIRDSGVTRLSIGIQSFDDHQLRKLGRLYSGDQALFFLKTASAVFENINIDIMYGNPNQEIQSANNDLSTAISFRPKHFSLYQLAIEPNTLFYKNPPKLPNEDQIWQMYSSNLDILNRHDYHRYEVSAFSLTNKECKHNLNYWEFGDYLGIGAGAHSKLTQNSKVERHLCKQNPNTYINLLSSQSNDLYSSSLSHHRGVFTVSTVDLPFEFMLNGLRLVGGVNLDVFTDRTGCSVDALSEGINIGIKKGLLEMKGNVVKASDYGLNFLNDLQLLFMTNHPKKAPIKAQT